MDSSEIDKKNIITTTMEELIEEECKAYLLVEEHVKAIEGLQEGSWWPSQEGGGVHNAISQA